jgi:hypothetical protein
MVIDITVQQCASTVGLVIVIDHAAYLLRLSTLTDGSRVRR